MKGTPSDTELVDAFEEAYGHLTTREAAGKWKGITHDNVHNWRTARREKREITLIGKKRRALLGWYEWHRAHGAGDEERAEQDRRLLLHTAGLLEQLAHDLRRRAADPVPTIPVDMFQPPGGEGERKAS